MKTQTNNTDSDFHAVDFMRQVRSELSKKYLQDKEQYLQDLKKAMEDFKRKQEKAYSQQIRLRGVRSTNHEVNVVRNRAVGATNKTSWGAQHQP